MSSKRLFPIVTVLLAAGSLAGVALLTAAESGGGTTAPHPCGPTAKRSVAQPTAAQLRAAGLAKLPLGSRSRRVDLVAPPFSNPTRVTNPLFPIARLQSAILNGRVDGKSFRTETTLLPNTRILEWTDGQCVEVLVSQYLAYSGGRIEEVALDHYAQDDAGSVWYLGEDVFNYDDGSIAQTAGTWLAGQDGPAALIMPAHPHVADVYRPENIAGLVFEEVTVKAVGQTVTGPRGPVRGAILVEELHDDGSRERKTFAPGYGEFFTGSGGDVEALALAVPTDARSGPEPAALRTLSSTSLRAYDQALAGSWPAARATVQRLNDAWRSHRRAGSVPSRLDEPATIALAVLARAVDGRRAVAAAGAALRLREAALDLELQYRPVAAIDLGRFDLWLRQVVVDARRDDAGVVSGDVATLEWIRDRVVRALGPVGVIRLDTLLRGLRTSSDDGELEAASARATALRKVVAGLAR
jgi:hypothetical protein